MDIIKTCHQELRNDEWVVYYIDKFGSLEEFIKFLYMIFEYKALFEKIYGLNDENINDVENLVSYLCNQRDFEIKLQNIMPSKFRGIHHTNPDHKFFASNRSEMSL